MIKIDSSFSSELGFQPERRRVKNSSREKGYFYYRLTNSRLYSV